VTVIALGIGSSDVVERPVGAAMPASVPVAALFHSHVAIPLVTIPLVAIFDPPALVSLVTSVPIPVSIGVPIAVVASIIAVVPIPLIGHGAVGSCQ
jgi:hypothetical protein